PPAESREVRAPREAPEPREARESRPAPEASGAAPAAATAAAEPVKEREVFVPRQEGKSSPAPAPSDAETAAPPARKAEADRPAWAAPAGQRGEGRESAHHDRPAGRETGEGPADTGDGRGGDEREPWWKPKKDNKKKGGTWDRHKGGGRSEGGR